MICKKHLLVQVVVNSDAIVTSNEGFVNSIFRVVNVFWVRMIFHRLSQANNKRYIFNISEFSFALLSAVLGVFLLTFWRVVASCFMWQQYNLYYREEEELNDRLKCFAENYSALYRGANTCQVQIGFGGTKRKLSTSSYIVAATTRMNSSFVNFHLLLLQTELSNTDYRLIRNNDYQCSCWYWFLSQFDHYTLFEAFNEPKSEQHPLPLGIEFQDLVDTFVHPKRKENKYEKAGRLIEQLQ